MKLHELFFGLAYFFIFTGVFTYIASLLFWRLTYPDREIRTKGDEFNRLMDLGQLLLMVGIFCIFIVVFLGLFL